MTTSQAKHLPWRTCGVVAVCGVVAWFLYAGWKNSTTTRLEEETLAALQSGNYVGARWSAEALLKHRPDSLIGLRATARCAWNQGKINDAIATYERLIEAGRDLEAIDHFAVAEMKLEDHDPVAAERHLRNALALDEELNAARQALVYLLSVECRHEEVLVQRQELLRRNIWTTEDLMFLAKPGDLFPSDALNAFLRKYPKEPYLLLAKARLALTAGEHDDAERRLDEVLVIAPNLMEAHVDRGVSLMKQDAPLQDFLDWHAALPEMADRSAEVWVYRGVWAMRRKEIDGAARCFTEALRLDPHHLTATHQLSIALAELGEDETAKQLGNRVGLLAELDVLVNRFYDEPGNNEKWMEAAKMLESLGRVREAAAWYRNVARVQGLAAAQTRADALEATFTRNTPLVLAKSNPVLSIDVDQFAIPEFDTWSEEVTSHVATSASRIRFTDVADRAGLEFNFIGSSLPISRDRKTEELLGAGTAVLDFDQDGWPDIYFAQGANVEGKLPEEVYRDQLFRNTGDGHFVDVSDSAGLGDAGHSQGVAIGDFNNDGFPDLMLGNIGPNRLYQNNGDGTFEDVTDAAGISGSVWTTSLAIADMNGDGLPDIYAVNYLADEVFSGHCISPNGKRGACSPRHFPAVPDRFYLNLGDGGFAEKSQELGFVAPDGKGLGVIAADFTGDGKLSVFVANDMSANHFFVNQSSGGDKHLFADRAILNGLGYDFNGYPQACMGVATHDADGDGRIDLFVTNYIDEANTLYRANASGTFEDVSRLTGLHHPSLPLLGFGTEFLDGDLDGDGDIVIANGHVSDDGPGETDFQMRPQLFENVNGKFVERVADDVGAYFGTKVLGRSLVSLDFDRDRRPDFAVSHLDAPAALLRNESQQSGHAVVIRVRGISGDRDAIGTTLTIETPSGDRRVAQVTAGDGYMCSNQRQLVFGLGEATMATKLTVRWRTGAIREFSDIAADREYILVEGRDELIELPR